MRVVTVFSSVYPESELLANKPSSSVKRKTASRVTRSSPDNQSLKLIMLLDDFSLLIVLLAAGE